MKKDYYVYIYLNQTKKGNWIYENLIFDYQPFYVGKGTGKRENIHLCPHMKKQKNIKNSIIKSIFAKTGEQPLHYRIYDCLTNEEAILIEKNIIKQFGRIDNKTGILSNCTDGGDGANNFSEDTLKKIGRKKQPVYQYDLNGNFIKKYESANLIKNGCNISTSIKRNGTYNGFIWSYEYKEKIEPKIKYQMPIKFVIIKQIEKTTGIVLNIFPNALEIEKNLNLKKGARNKIYECINGKTKSAYGYAWKI